MALWSSLNLISETDTWKGCITVSKSANNVVMLQSYAKAMPKSVTAYQIRFQVMGSASIVASK